MTVKLGQQRAVRMRRIGERHMIVLPAQSAQLLSLDTIEQQIAQARQQRHNTAQQLARLDAFIGDLEQQVVAFKQLPIEHDEDDPDVPHSAPEGPPDDLAARFKTRARPVHLPIVKA